MSLLIAALVLAILPSLLASGTVEVTVEGVAAVVEGDDPGRIRDEAIRDALRRAVEVGTGVMVRAESQMENYEVLRDQIWIATSGYVVSYDVLREMQDDLFFRITIRALVDALRLGEDLEELGFEISLIGNPRIVVAVKEWVCENEPGAAPVCLEQPFSIAGDGLEEALHEKGFTLVDPARLAEISDPDLLNQAAEGDVDAAAALARALDADLTLAGDLRAEPAGVTSAGGFDWHKALAMLSAQVVLRDTGEVVSATVVTGEATKTSFASASRAAIEDATDQAVPQLVIETIAGLNYQDTELSREIRVHVEGVPGFTEAVGIQKAFEAIREVQAADLRTYEAGLAALDIQFLGTSVELAQLLEAPWFRARLADELGAEAAIVIEAIDYGSIEAGLVLN